MAVSDETAIFLFITVLIIDLILTNHCLILNYLFCLIKTQLTPDY